jgi:hypothetical protein
VRILHNPTTNTTLRRVRSCGLLTLRSVLQRATFAIDSAECALAGLVTLQSVLLRAIGLTLTVRVWKEKENKQKIIYEYIR